MFAIGSVILFVTSGVGVIIVGSYFLALAARFYLTTVQETAVGIDAIDWPRESPTDWIGSAIATLIQVFIWIMPAGFLARAIASSWLPENPPLRYALLMGLAAWLLFPPGFLLTMASSQAGNPARRLLFGLHILLLFYLLSGVVCLLGVGVAYLGLFGDWYWLLIAIIAGPMLLLLHGRLVGRLGYFLGREEVPREPPKKSRKSKDREPSLADFGETEDPWAVPEPTEEITPRRKKAAPEPESQGYGLAAEEPPPRPPLDLPLPEPRPRTRRRRERDAEIEADENEPSVAFRPESTDKEIERERKLRNREELPPPRSLFFHGVWEFPLYPSTLEAIIWLLIYGLLAGGMVRFMLSVAPFGGGDG